MIDPQKITLFFLVDEKLKATLQRGEYATGTRPHQRKCHSNKKNSSYTQFSVFKETDKNYFLYLFNNNESVREIFFWIDLKLSDYIFEL